MTKVLGLDLSTHTGYAFCTKEEGEDAKLVKYGTIHLERSVHEFGKYPYCYREAAKEMARLVVPTLIEKFQPDVVVIEETNGGRNRYTQKLLENIHRAALDELETVLWNTRVVYLDSSEWRCNLGLKMTKEQKKSNAKLRKAMRAAAAKGEKVDKKKLGIKGLVNPKHVAINYVNEKFGTKLKMKENDAADGICLCLAYLNNARPCDGV